MSTFSAEEEEYIQKLFNTLLNSCPKCTQDEGTKQLVYKAFDIAHRAHYGVRRKSGEPYIIHPIEVAKIASGEIGLGATSVVCALLHDVVEDTDITLEEIESLFDHKTAQIIDGLTKIRGALKTKAGQAENFKKMILTLAEDVRVIIIKIADRLHNMRTLESMPEDKQISIATETQNLFVPLAHRLGFYNIKMELEDLCLKFLQPTAYHNIAKQLKGSEKKRVHYLNRFSIPIMIALEQNNIEFNITSRSKSIASIWHKMQKQGVEFENVYDVFAIRIILTGLTYEEEKAACWKVYSIITDKYTPNPQRLRDWISTPKDNGYEALHTTAMGPDGNWVEIQIRTQRMDEIAERGYAAHWKYKNIEGYEKSQLEIWMDRVRQTLENPDGDALSFLDEFKLNLYSNDLFAFTPKGEMHRFPLGATALDFAYEIHTGVGNKAIGARINKNKTVPLTYKIQSGDQIEILTTESQKPQKEWLDIVTTAKAKNALHQVFKIDNKKLILQGQKIIKDILTVNNIPINNITLTKLYSGYKVTDSDELYKKAALNEIDINLVVEYATQKRDRKKIPFWKFQFRFGNSNTNEITEEAPINPNLKTVYNPNDYQIASCCHPIPGDSILAFKKDLGYEIHKNNCPLAIELQVEETPLEINWVSRKASAFLVRIHIEGIDRMGILKELIALITEEFNINIRTIHIDTRETQFFGSLDLYVTNLQHLNTLMLNLRKIKGISKVNRADIKNKKNP